MGFGEQSGGWVWGEQSRGWRLGSRMGCKEGRMRIFVIEWGVKSLIFGVLSNGVYRDIKGV